MNSPSEQTLDTVRGLRFVQRVDGYRFTLDAVLLATFAQEVVPEDAPSTVVDLGTGCGVVALLLAEARPLARVVGVEVQPSLARLARRNAEENELPVEVIEGDWRRFEGEWRADLIVSNPPYFLKNSGKLPPDPERCAARHEINGGLDTLAESVARRLNPGGACRLIHAAGRFGDLLSAFAAHEIFPTLARFVHPRAGDDASTVLLELRPKSRRALVVQPPLVLQGSSGRSYLPEVERMLTPLERRRS